MKHLKTGLLIEGILAIILSLIMYFVLKLENSLLLLVLPFDLIGKGLRWLSLHSYWGNLLALILYLLLSLLPVFYLIMKRIKSKFSLSDIFLPIISLYSFYMIYEFINPRLMMQKIPSGLSDQGFTPILKLSFVIIFYALCIGNLIFRMLEHLSRGNDKNRLSFLYKKLQFILILFASLYTFLFGYFLTYQFLSDLSKYSNQTDASIQCAFTLIAYLSNSLPILFSILTIVASIQLLESMRDHHLQQEELQSAIQLGAISKLTVIVTVICDLAINALQFLLSKELSDTNYILQISFLPLIIAFVAVILSGCFKETKELYEDNNMII